MPQPLAKWNPTRDAWETEQMDLFSGHSDVFSEIWPRSGSMRNGVAYELPTWAHRTAGQGSSSSLNGDDDLDLFPTPTVQDGSNNGGPSQFGRNTPPLNTRVLMLPTPTARDHKGHNQRRDATCLTGALLPTPRVPDTNGAGRHGTGGAELRTIVDEDLTDTPDWGAYVNAIDRWGRVLGRPSPAPTIPDGRNGKHRLSAAFVEWMMGLPEGWVTDVDITRNDQLKALGNGVVPQQCSAALRDMLSTIQREDPVS